jgi:predicted nucleotidyltransferase component of viral defense system
VNSSTQLKALLRNFSKEKNINAQILLRNYMLERLLERISLSKYKDSFILKGGMLISAMLGIDMRSTLDMDATIKGQAVSKENMTKILSEIIKVKIDDGVDMKLLSIEEIQEEATYTGLRASIETSFDGIKNILKIDLTTGDSVIPREITYKFKLMLEDREIYIWAYNIETVLAEKIETIISRSIANTRMRDFYDVYTLFSMYKDTIDMKLLNEALNSVATRRGTLDLVNNAENIIKNISADEELKALWNSYSKKYEYAQNIKYEDTIKIIQEILSK